jgi:hypothetical protein
VTSYNPWAKHYQSEWERRAGNIRLPLWLRVASLAYGKHRGNGHAQYRPGEIALSLSSVDDITGEIKQPLRQQVHVAIRVAVEHGFLSPSSGSRCLVVPAHAVAGGEGHPFAPCSFHEPRHKATGRRTVAA